MDVTSFGSRARLKPEMEIQQQRGFSGENARGAFSLTMISWPHSQLSSRRRSSASAKGMLNPLWPELEVVMAGTSAENIYIAGVDSNAIIMIWAMAELVRNPRVMKKAQEEIRTCIGINSKEKLVEEHLIVQWTTNDRALRCYLLVLVGGSVQVLLLGLRLLNWDFDWRLPENTEDVDMEEGKKLGISLLLRKFHLSLFRVRSSPLVG
ncbi:hypothetical protein Bca101_094622 [Brassica carinata]